MTKSEEIWETIKDQITEDSDEDADDRLMAESGYIDALLSEIGDIPPSYNWEEELDKLRDSQE